MPSTFFLLLPLFFYQNILIELKNLRIKLIKVDICINLCSMNFTKRVSFDSSSCYAVGYKSLNVSLFLKRPSTFVYASYTLHHQWISCELQGIRGKWEFVSSIYSEDFLLLFLKYIVVLNMHDDFVRYLNENSFERCCFRVQCSTRNSCFEKYGRSLIKSVLSWTKAGSDCLKFNQETCCH